MRPADGGQEFWRVFFGRAVAWLRSHTLLVLCGALLFGGAASALAIKFHLPARVRDFVSNAMPRNPSTSGVWWAFDSTFGTFDVVRAQVFNDNDGHMAALEELDGRLIFMTQRGAFSYLNAANEVHSLPMVVPMRTDALRAAQISGLNYDFFRALDMLAVKTGPQQYDLYVSYNRFNPDATCFQIVVSRMRMTANGDAIAPASDWEDLFETHPCVPPRPTPDRFIGIQSGGRLARLNDATLLLSIGDLEFDGVAYPGLEHPSNGPQDPTWDLGKIIAIDLASGRARHWAMGFRNPQGLMVDAEHRVWETEHGPRGGDEINLLHERGNYGWPNVTYGMSYGAVGLNWPLNPTFGGHLGYEPPLHAFVPSVGISQLVQPSAEEFPFWPSSLLVTSLAGRTLFRARVEGNRIAYVEALTIGEDRMRDIINRENGEIAILGDFGALYFLRGVHGEPGGTLTIVDRRDPAPHSAEPESLADAGETLFANRCGSCHSLTGRVGVGPPLTGVVGRAIASTTFNYSPALRNAHGVWTEERLRGFLTRSDAQFAQSTMPDPQLNNDQSRALVAYLENTSPQLHSTAAGAH